MRARLVLSLLSLLLESDRWHAPSAVGWGSIAFNAVLVLGFAQPAWFFLVRGLPPVASTLSVMMIPVLGVFSGAVWLGERLHWQDWAAVALMVLAVGSGSLFLSHVNDAGFWLVKQYLGTSVVQTFKTWTVMECLLSVTGLLGVLLLSVIV